MVDTLAEWLRRRPAKPLGSARTGSNPVGVVNYKPLQVHSLLFWSCHTNSILSARRRFDPGHTLSKSTYPR